MTKRQIDAVRNLVSWVKSGLSPRYEGQAKKEAEVLSRWLREIDPRLRGQPAKRRAVDA